MKSLIFLFILLSFPMLQAAEVHVAVAANFTTPMELIAKSFTQETGHVIIPSFGSTGKLYTQIIHGAPYEILLSADQIHVKKLIQEDKALGSSAFAYAVGKLVLWSPKERVVDAQGEVLKKMEYRHISIANPKLAPYGAAAKEVLEKMELWQNLQKKIVLGENINQAHQFVSSGNAELGFVAYSQIIKDGKTIGSFWSVPQNLYSPIRQDAVLLKKGVNSDAAQKFITFLQSEKIRNIIQRFGYELK